MFGLFVAMTVTFVSTSITNPLPIIFVVSHHFTVRIFCRLSFGTCKGINNPVAVCVLLCILPLIRICENVCTIVPVSPLFMCVCICINHGTPGRGANNRNVSPVNQASYTVVLRRRRQRNLKCFHPLNEEGLRLGVKSAQGTEE